MAHYAHDENNNRIETLSKEEVYALLAAAIQQGQLPSVDEDTAFVTMIKSIVDGKPYKIGFCTQAQYNELAAQGLLEADALYVITDDETYDDIETALTNLSNDIDVLQTALTNGDFIVYKAQIASKYYDANGDLQNLADLDERVSDLEGIHLYRHDITWGAITGQDCYIHFTLYTNDSEELTNITLKNYLTVDKPINAGGFIVLDNVKYIVMYLTMRDVGTSSYSYDATTIKDGGASLPSALGLGNTTTISSRPFSDTVTTLF